ncbi:ribonuclease H-like domain-containing protein [Tanacetum coccineum]
MKLLDGSWFTRISYADGLSTIIPYAPIRSDSGQEQAVYYRSYRALRRMIRRSRRCASRSTLQQPSSDTTFFPQQCWCLGIANLDISPCGVWGDGEVMVLLSSCRDFKLTDESYVLLKVPSKDNMYSVDLNNVVPQGGLTCLFAKATPDESNLWHRRLGHVNFETMNKLVKGNLVRGLPSKLFEINQTCVACQKGKQHRASCRKPALSFMRPFECPVTILKPIDHLGSGPNCLFDIDALTNSMNYKPVVAGNQSNGSTCTKACDDAGKTRMATVPGKYHILLLLWTQDPPFSSSSKDSLDAGFKPLGEEEKKDVEDPENEDSEVLSIKEPRVNQEKDASVNNTNTINTVSLTVNTAGIEDNAIDENIVYRCVDDPNIPELDEIAYSDDDDEDVGAEADIKNLDTHILVSPIPTTRIHKDHPIEQIIGYIYSAPQTRRMTKSVTEQAMFSSVQQRTNHKEFQNCLFACFLSQEEPKKVIQALKDTSWIEAMQEELLQFKLQ